MNMYKFLKRVIDILISLSALIILSPILIPVMIGLLLTGEHYIFYFQERIGLRNKPFYIWKFATMLKNSPNIGTGTITLRKDPRVLPMGGFLRKTKINELPQIFNVLFGTMSIVGPRPLTKNHFDKYSDDVKAVLYKTKPGITGVGSIVFRDEEEMISNCNMPVEEFYTKYISPYKGALEVWYGSNKSIILDIKIIILTAWVILFPKSDLMYKWLKDLPEKPKNNRK